MQTLLSSLIGIPIGILCSLAAWWLLFHKITPQVVFSQKISKVLINGKYRYRIKFQNVGARRIIDISLHARMYVSGIYQELPNNITAVQIKLKTDYWPVLSKKEMKMSGVDPDHITFKDSIFPSEAKQKH